MGAGVHRGHRYWSPLELEFQMVINPWTWVLRTKLESFARAPSTGL